MHNRVARFGDMVPIGLLLTAVGTHTSTHTHHTMWVGGAIKHKLTVVIYQLRKL